MDSSENSINLINFITGNKDSKLRNLFFLLLELQNIDRNMIISNFSSFLSSYSSVEQHYKKKYSLIKTQNKKTYMLLLLNSFTFGVLSVVLPYLSFINSINFSEVKNTVIKTLIFPTLELSLSFEFYIFILVLTLIYKQVYVTSSQKKQIKDFLLISIIFLTGFLFTFLMLKPKLHI
jgi:hypothetical protein